MGIDLELADCAAAGYQLTACREAATACVHDPACEENYDRLLARAAADRPGEPDPSEFRYRRFLDINENMQLTGMGHATKPKPWEEPDLQWRSQTSPGGTGIPSFKLESNDRWLLTVREIDEALAAYANTPAELKAALEADQKWVCWLEWLAVAREHGGFEAE